MKRTNNFYKTVLPILLTFIFALLTCFTVFSQSGAAINTSGATADPSAILDVSSSNQGILIPRMTEAQKQAIPLPIATGLMIYQTDATTGFWYYDGTAWVQSIGVAGIAGSTGATGPTGQDGAAGATGSAASCPPANAGETLINFNGCLYVKNVDETGTYTWANAKTQCTGLGSGWYLPNKDELHGLYLNWNQPASGGDCQGVPCPLTGFSLTAYWSSTVHNPINARIHDFSSGNQGSDSNMNSTCLVRCVRR